MPATAQGALTARPRQTGSVVRAIQFLFVLFVLTAVGMGLWSVVRSRPQAEGAPAQVAGYSLTSSTSGPEALQMVDRLHQGSPQLTDALVAYYQQGGMLWVGNAASPSLAQQYLIAMAQAIERGGTPFSPPEEVLVSGQWLFKTSDSMATHYFFQSGPEVIWVTAPTGSGTRFVEAILVRYQE